jgi:ketosteroid isomerase-like protein
MPNLDTARAVLARYNQAILEKNAEILASVYAENGVHEMPFMHDAPPMRGRHEVLARYTAGWGATTARVDAIKNVVLHAVEGGDTFVVEEDIDITNTANGKQFGAATVLVMTLAGDKIERMRDYTDNLTIAVGLGRVPNLNG